MNLSSLVKFTFIIIVSIYIYLYLLIGLINVAGGGDSFYEYLIKNYLLQEEKDESLFETWQDSVESMEEYMLSSTAEDPSIQFVSMISNSSVYYVSQELVTIITYLLTVLISCLLM